MIARSAWLTVTVLLLTFVGAPRARGQTTAVDKLKAMSGDPDALDGKLTKKDKDRPPFEFFRSQITPFDVLPYVKRNHWATLNIEMQANLGGYEGYLQTTPEVNGKAQVPLYDPNGTGRDMRNEVIYRREALLQKEQRASLGMQMMLPYFGKELSLELARPDAIRPDGFWSASLMRLEPHQMVIPVLSTEPSAYSSWGRMQATLPTSGDRDSGSIEIEKQRYYRMALLQSDRPPLSANPLTWTSISHIVWDGLPPEKLTTVQQQALIDWLYLGGQLIVVAAGPTSIAPLEKSFLKDFLPATDSGKSARLSQDDLEPLARLFPPPFWPNEGEEMITGVRRTRTAALPRYKPSDPIRPTAERPLFVAGLVPKPGASAIPLGDPGKNNLAVEWRVGRGRVLMFACNPNDPALAAWTGMDSLVRRVMLRRVEEAPTPSADRRDYAFLSGPELTWVRLLGRDLGATYEPSSSEPAEPNDPIRREPVAAWLDTTSKLPVMSRDVLEEASGITIPDSKFVLKVIVGYVLVLVPLNWLVCRFVLRRREWAWAAVPLLALGFAVSVERAAAYDMGFDTDCTEIDLLELQGGYARGHVNRVASIYSTGRDRYSISYPNDPSAVALPLNTQRALRGEESTTSIFESFPEPALKGFQVQPRSLAMFRAEAIVELPGTAPELPPGIALGGEKGDQIVNNTLMDLHDAVLVDVDNKSETPLGTIGSGETVPLAGPAGASKAKPAKVDWTDVRPFLKALTEQRYETPEEAGELRLVAWTPDPHPGEKFEPKIDRHRGFRLVVVHLKYGPLPDPSGPSYYSREGRSQARVPASESVR